MPYRTDCLKCWDSPCSCGYEYRDMTEEHMAEKIVDILGYRNKESLETILQLLNQMIPEKIEKIDNLEKRKSMTKTWFFVK